MANKFIDIHNAGKRAMQVVNHLGEEVQLLPGKTIKVLEAYGERLKAAYRDLISPDDLRSEISTEDTSALTAEISRLEGENSTLKGQLDETKIKLADSETLVKTKDELLTAQTLITDKLMVEILKLKPDFKL